MCVCARVSDERESKSVPGAILIVDSRIDGPPEFGAHERDKEM